MDHVVFHHLCGIVGAFEVLDAYFIGPGAHSSARRDFVTSEFLHNCVNRFSESSGSL